MRTGRVALSLPEGARASAHHLGSWRIAEPRFGLTAQMLLGEVADELDRLNDRPDSTRRCLQAVQEYVNDPTEERRLVVRDRYLAIPEHLRVYALGDMDLHDVPLQVLVTDLGGTVERPHGEPPDGPEQAENAPVYIRHTVYPRGWPDPPGTEALQNDYPAPITVAGRSYPSVAHAYWALSRSDPEMHDRIAEAARGFDARKLAEQAPRREGWAAARLAVMSTLLRAKYTQHPALADVLLSTGDARIMYVDFDSGYWAANGQHPSNWVGRLLELVRSELAAARSGIPLT